MAHFQIFLPDARDSDHAEQLAAAGLAHLATGFDPLQCDGPDGQSGVCLAWRTPQQTRMGYRPDEQTWLPAVPDGDLPAKRYYVGLWNDSPPTPKDLQRPYAAPGRWLRLGDGNQWLIPESAELPADRILADDGSWKFEVQREFHDFHLECQRWADVVAEADKETTIPWEELDAFNRRALQINYRIVPELVSHLRLFNSANMAQPLFAAIGALRAAESAQNGSSAQT